MTIKFCVLCNEDPTTKRLYGNDGLEDGQYCPICQQPACRYHLTIVRWRWRNSGETDSTLVCHSCKRTYAHRNWDAFNRDWIT